MTEDPGRAIARATWTRARADAAALAATDRLGPRLTPVLRYGVLPQLDAALLDLDLGVAAADVRRLSAPLREALDCLEGPLGLAPILRPLRADVIRGLDALA